MAADPGWSVEDARPQCHVMYIGLDDPISGSPDVAEVFSPPRISKVAEAVGLKSGKAYDLTTGFDFQRPEVRKRVLTEIREQKPDLVVICPPCDKFSSLCNLNGYRGSNSWIKGILKAWVLLRFAMEVAKVQVECGRFEHPDGARSWQEKCVLRIRCTHGVDSVVFDQCMYGSSQQQAT